MLHIENATCGYGQNTVLNDIDIVIGCGEFVGVIGPNGSGKTTLVRLLSRAIAPASGKVLLRNTDIFHMPMKNLAKEIAVVSQNQPVSDMTVEEYVSLGRIPHHGAFQFFDTENDRTAVEKAMEVTGAINFRGRSLGQMSGGERQLVFIARALAQEPKVLLLDEPTNHLDIAHQVIVLDLIRRLNRTLQITLVMVLHDLNLAGEYCQRLLLIDRGRVHSDGSPEEVLTYQKIESVYKTVVVVSKNPVSSKPFVIPVSEDERKGR